MIEVYTSDDYAALDNDKYSFYYGYESTVCEDCEQTEDKCSCEEFEEVWCFEVRDSNDKLIMLIPEYDLEVDGYEPVDYLLAGIGRFIDEIA